MRSPGINGEGELRGQLANPGSPGKMAIKTEFVCVCVCVLVNLCNVTFAAVRAKSIECVRLILEQEAVDVNCQNYVNTSALHAAVSTGQLDVTALLLEHGARPDILEDLNITPVFTASQLGQTECLKLLLDSLRTSGVWFFNYLSLSVRFNGQFPGGPGLAGTRMCPFWISLELKLMEVVMTTGAIRCAKLQYHNKPTPSFLQVGCPSCRPTNSVRTLKEEVLELSTYLESWSYRMPRCPHILYISLHHLMYSCTRVETTGDHKPPPGPLGSP